MDNYIVIYIPDTKYKRLSHWKFPYTFTEIHYYIIVSHIFRVQPEDLKKIYDNFKKYYR